MADVAIVGAGIGGLCAAHAVALAGHRPVLIERDVGAPIGAALGLWPNAIHALDRLGRGEAVRGAGMTARRLLIRSAEGSLLTETDVEAVARSAGAPMLLIERPELHRLLADGLDPPRQDTVTGVEDGGVALAGGERIAAAAIIGSDGIGSVVRRHVAPDSGVLDAGYTAVRALADYALPDGLACEAWGRDELVGATALRSGRTYWFFEAPTHRFDGAKPLAVVNGRRWPEPWPSIFAATNPEGVLVHAIRTVSPLPTWHRGRVAVLGDAAHAMEPNLAQGAAQAIEDAAALLTALETHADLPEALSVYAGARRGRATMMQRESGRMARLALNRHTRARDLLLRATPQPVRARMIKRLLTA